MGRMDCPAVTEEESSVTPAWGPRALPLPQAAQPGLCLLGGGSPGQGQARGEEAASRVAPGLGQRGCNTPFEMRRVPPNKRLPAAHWVGPPGHVFATSGPVLSDTSLTTAMHVSAVK